MIVPGWRKKYDKAVTEDGTLKGLLRKAWVSSKGDVVKAVRNYSFEKGKPVIKSDEYRWIIKCSDGSKTYLKSESEINKVAIDKMENFYPDHHTIPPFSKDIDIDSVNV